jgi:hypothetical protein
MEFQELTMQNMANAKVPALAARNVFARAGDVDPVSEPGASR